MKEQEIAQRVWQTVTSAPTAALLVTAQFVKGRVIQMSDFQREDRYIVVKRKDLDVHMAEGLEAYLYHQGIPRRECVVVEPDWPNYEHVWDTVRQVAQGEWPPEPIFAPAQIVEVVNFDEHGKTGWVGRYDEAPVGIGASVTAKTDNEGRPYVSAIGLEPWAQFVAVDGVRDLTGHDVFQYSCKPLEYQSNSKWGGASKIGAKFIEAPETHAIPGPPENSLAVVWRS